MLKDFSRSSSSASSFASVVEEAEGVDGDDTGLVRGPGSGDAPWRPEGGALWSLEMPQAEAGAWVWLTCDQGPQPKGVVQTDPSSL